MQLTAETWEQQNAISEMIEGCDKCTSYCVVQFGVEFDGWMDFDTMAKIVDYLRKEGNL